MKRSKTLKSLLREVNATINSIDSLEETPNKYQTKLKYLQFKLDIWERIFDENEDEEPETEIVVKF